MELCKVEKSDYPYLKALYMEAFPAEERAPFRMLTKRAEQGKGDFRLIREGEQNIGMVYLVTDGKLAYLFYFAVQASLRGQGLGTRALKAVVEEYKEYRFFLALEDWREAAGNQAQRIKRHDFYRRCGLQDFPYKLKEASVRYAIMGIGKAVEPEEYKQMMNRYVGFPMKYLVDMRIIKEP